MGRKPIGDKPMTPAQRKRLQRARALPPFDATEEAMAIADRLGRPYMVLGADCDDPMAAAAADVALLIDALEAEVARLKAGGRAPGPPEATSRPRKSSKEERHAQGRVWMAEMEAARLRPEREAAEAVKRTKAAQRRGRA
jgi:hypothetical protein